MEITQDFEIRKLKEVLMIDIEILKKYDLVYRFENEKTTETTCVQVEIERFGIFDKITGEEILIFDIKVFDKTEKVKLNTLFYMVYLYRTIDFRNRIARHERELTFGNGITDLENSYIENANKIQEDLIKLLEMKNESHDNLRVSFNVYDIKDSDSPSKANKLNDNKKVEFKSDIYAKWLVESSIKPILSILSYPSNNYIDSFFYFCQVDTTITVEKIKNELSKIPSVHKVRKKGNEISNLNNYLCLLTGIIQNFISKEKLKINKRLLPTQKYQLFACHLLVVFGFLPNNKLTDSFISPADNTIDEKKVIDYIRKLNPEVTSSKGKKEDSLNVEIATYLQKNIKISEIEDRYPNFVQQFNKYSLYNGWRIRAYKDNEGQIIYSH